MKEVTIRLGDVTVAELDAALAYTGLALVGYSNIPLTASPIVYIRKIPQFIAKPITTDEEQAQFDAVEAQVQKLHTLAYEANQKLVKLSKVLKHRRISKIRESEV